MTYRLRNILLAVVLAVLAAFLTALYVASYQNRVDRGQEKVKVYLATDNLAPGTAAGDLRGKVELREVLRKHVVPAPVYDLQTLEGQTTSQWVYAGEQLTTRRFTLAGQGGIRSDLKGNLRAFQLSGNQHQLLAGTLRTGDHVDLVVNLKLPGDGERYATRTVLRDIPVLQAASGEGVSSKLASGPANSSLAVLLQVTDAQGQKLLSTTSRHIWTLVLRPVADAVDSPESLTTLPSVLNDGLAGRNR